MFEDKALTESEAHLLFAKRYNGKTWEWFDKKERTTLCTAHAGDIIVDKEDCQIFFDDFNSGNWNGLK
jgi:hypothetical protein